VGELFKKIAAEARLLQKQLKLADKTPLTYDGKSFRLDSVIELRVNF